MYGYYVLIANFIQASHVLFSQSNVLLSLETPLIAATEVISLPAIPLQTNQRYAVTIVPTTPNTTRTILGAKGLNSAQCALVYNGIGKNASFVYPISYVPAFSTFDFFAQINGVLGPSTMTIALALQPLTFSSDLVSSTLDGLVTGFGQTWNSGSEVQLTSIALQVAAGQTSGNAMNVTLQIIDVSLFGSSENIIMPYFQETSSPTPIPTKGPTQSPSRSPSSRFPSQFPTSQSPTSYGPTSSTSPITQVPTLFPSSRIPTTQFPTVSPSLRIMPASKSPSTSNSYFKRPECPEAIFPSIFANAQVTCDTSLTTTMQTSWAPDVVVGEMRDLRWTNNTNNTHFDLPVYFRVALSSFGVQAMADDAVINHDYSLHCAWLSPNGDVWDTSGCWLIDETNPTLLPLLHQYFSESNEPGYICATTHFTMFTLILRRDECLSCHTDMQIVCTAIALILSTVAFVQVIRMLRATKLCTRLVLLHGAIFVAGIILSILSYLFPLLAPTHPGVLILLSSVVTMIELGCYMNLIYIWISPLVANSASDPLYKLTWAFYISYAVLAISMLMVPVILLTGSSDGVARWAIGGSYFMCSVLLIVFIGLAVTGIRVYKQLLSLPLHILPPRAPSHGEDQKSNNNAVVGVRRRGGSELWRLWCSPRRCCPLPRRLCVGSILLCFSILTQAILWILSIRASILSTVIMTSTIEWAFNIALFITFFTLLFLFWFGVSEVTTKSDNILRERGSFVPTNDDPSIRPSRQRRTLSSEPHMEHSHGFPVSRAFVHSAGSIAELMAVRQSGSSLDTSSEPVTLASTPPVEQDISSSPSLTSRTLAGSNISDDDSSGGGHHKTLSAEVFPPHYHTVLENVVESDEIPTPKTITTVLSSPKTTTSMTQPSFFITVTPPN